MKKIVIIGANDFQNQLIVKAKEMGFETHVFAWADGSVGEHTADYFYPISIMEVDKIIEKCKAASHHEHDHIMPKSVRQLAGRYQKDREFDIFSIKNMVEISVCVAYVHIDHRMHSQKSSIKDIFQKPAEKAHPKPFLFPFHKAERRRYDYHQIRTDGTDGQGLEYGTLKQESNQYDQYGHNPALHF